MRRAASHWRWSIAVVAGALVVASAGVSAPANVAWAEAGEEHGLRVVGELPALVGCTPDTSYAAIGGAGADNRYGPCPLLVDPVRNLGFAFGAPRVGGAGVGHQAVDENFVAAPASQGELRIYDLARMAVIGRERGCSDAAGGDVNWLVPTGALQGNSPISCGLVQRGAVDSSRSLLWAPTLVHNGMRSAPATCQLVRHDYGQPSDIASALVVYDACPRRPPEPSSPVAGQPGGDPLSGGARPLVHLGVHRSDVDDALYLTGTWGEEAEPRRPGSAPDGGAARPGPYDFTFENVGQSLVVRRLTSGAGVDGKELAYDWDVDLRFAGCGRRVGWHPGEPPSRPFVGRVGDDLLAYCWDPRPVWWSPSLFGDQGYLVRIPLEDDKPIPLQGEELSEDPTSGALINYRYVRTPTLPGYLEATIDTSTGTVLLVTDGPPNGNAVWVFDPKTDRFVGVATGGFGDQPRGGTSVGVDQVRGRVYMTTQEGLLLVRTRPLSGGLIFPVAENPERQPGFVNTRLMAVAPSLRRVFVPVNFADQQEPQANYPNLSQSTSKGARWLVVEDTYPDARLGEDPDPDASTSQLPEDPKTTATVSGGQALASGVHVVVTGGLARTIDQADPACHAEVPFQGSIGDLKTYFGIVLEPEQGEVVIEHGRSPETAEKKFDLKDGAEPKGAYNDLQGQDQFRDYEQPGTGFQPFGSEGCVADQVINPGHRELSFAAADAETGSNVGALARGSGLSFGSTDVTDADVRNGGACGQGTIANLAQGHDVSRDPDGTDSDYAERCTDTHDETVERGGPDLRTGTRGPDGRGFPIPASRCGDFGGAPQRDRRGGELAAEGPASAFHASATECDVAKVYAKAETTAAALTVASDPVVSVARAQSAVFSVKDPERGQLTVAWASAQGVRIGPLLIREVKSLAITQAQGRKGTASAKLVRVWCGIGMVSGVETDPETAGREGPLPLPGQGCVDPAKDPATQDMIASVNQQLTKVRISVPPANGKNRSGEATPGGYQAVVTKDPDIRAGDQAVNHDDSHTVSAMEVVVYNDGSQGLNRVVVQLAGVHAESRYGIIPLPNFNGGGNGNGTGSLPSGPEGGTPEPAPIPEAPVVTQPGPAAVSTSPESFLVEERLVTEAVRFSPPPPTPRVLPSGDGGPLRRIIEVPVDALRGAINLLVQHPREFGLLFLLFSLLAAPLYLGSRRRSFARALVAT